MPPGSSTRAHSRNNASRSGDVAPGILSPHEREGVRVEGHVSGVATSVLDEMGETTRFDASRCHPHVGGHEIEARDATTDAVCQPHRGAAETAADIENPAVALRRREAGELLGGGLAAW